MVDKTECCTASVVTLGLWQSRPGLHIEHDVPGTAWSVALSVKVLRSIRWGMADETVVRPMKSRSYGTTFPIFLPFRCPPSFSVCSPQALHTPCSLEEAFWIGKGIRMFSWYILYRKNFQALNLANLIDILASISRVCNKV